MDGQWLAHMFQLSLPVLEKIVRTVIVYLFLIVGLRLSGKRELAQLNPFDLVVLLMLSNTVQNAIIGDDNSVTGGLVGAATLLLVNALLVRFLYRHRKLDEIVEGKSALLIRRGKVDRQRLQKELITEAELEAAARRQGIASLKDVEEASLEPDGTVSFILREPELEEKRHRELMKQIDALAKEIAALRAQVGLHSDQAGLDANGPEAQ